MTETKALLHQYYEAFNRQDNVQMLACLSDSIVHEVSQGETRNGKEKFWEFLEHMHNCYHEQLSEIVLMISDDGSRAAAEFNLHGKYLKTDAGLPEAEGQEYQLRVGTFFEIAEGKIARVSTHYNLNDWTKQVVG